MGLALRVLPILLGSPSACDVAYFLLQAWPVSHNMNIYQVTHAVFPYPPLTLFIPALCLLLSDKLKIPFYITAKIPPLIGDIFLSIAIYYWLIRVKRDRGIALKGAIFYTANPIIILISAFLGNIMSLANLFMFLAVMLVLYDCDRSYRLSALLLGLGIAFRGYPILILPLILLKTKLSGVKKMKYLAYVLVPVAIIFIPFLCADYKSVFREILGYNGFCEFGLYAIGLTRASYSYVISHSPTEIANMIMGSALPIVELADKVSPLNRFMEIWLANSKSVFLLVYLIILIQFRRLNLLKLILLTYLGFYFFYGRVTAQYFIWVVPFFYFFNDKFSNWYIILCSYAIISVFLCIHENILFGRLPIGMNARDVPMLLLNELAALFSFWALCGIWFFNLLFNRTHEARQ